MGYYQGDYYAGGRGGIGSFFQGALGLASSFIPGVGGVVGKVLSKVARPAAAGMAATGGIVGAGRAIAARGTAAIIKHPVLSAAGAAGAVGLVGAGIEHQHYGRGRRPDEGLTTCRSTGAATVRQSHTWCATAG